MSKEPCMCGDYECPFCGPLQGNMSRYQIEEERDVHDDEIHGVGPYSFDKVWREECDE